MVHLLEIDGSWIIQPENIEVTKINIAPSFDLFCEESDDNYIWISLDDFQIRSRDDDLLKCTMDQDKHQRALELIHQKLESVIISEQGRIDIFFSNGMKIFASDDPDTAWQLTSPDLRILKKYNEFEQITHLPPTAD